MDLAEERGSSGEMRRVAGLYVMGSPESTFTLGGSVKGEVLQCPTFRGLGFAFPKDGKERDRGTKRLWPFEKLAHHDFSTVLVNHVL